MSDGELRAEDLCQERPWPHLSACVRPADHSEPCVFAKGSKDGASLTLYERGRKGSATFKAIYDIELEPGTRIGRVDASALLVVCEAQGRIRLP